MISVEKRLNSVLMTLKESYDIYTQTSPDQ